MKAKEAYEKSLIVVEKMKKKQLESIKKLIQDAISVGKFYIMIDFELHTENIDILTNEGYVIKSLDQEYIEISWDLKEGI